MATLRIKSEWFKAGAPKTPAQSASVMAFTSWRVAINALKGLRDAGFDIDPGPAYFGVVRELLVFLLCGIDRMAYARLGPEGRAPFTAALVQREAEILRDNEADLLGPLADGDYAERFIDQFNALAPHYAEFDWSAAEGPDFGFMRYLGNRLEPLLPEKDRRWIIEQLMLREAPEAVQFVQRAMDGLFDRTPRRARRGTMTGE